MILAIERDARDAKNECGSARALLSAARDAPGDLAPRLRKRLRAQVAPALASSQPDCLVDVAALLVPLLPDGDKRAVIGDLAQLYEKGLNGWGLYRAVMPAIAPHLTADEARRFADAVSTQKGVPCFRTIVLAHLADVGRAPPAAAFAAMKESRDRHCLEVDELNVLRFADAPTLRTLYPREMALLDQPPKTFALEHVRALALLAPYLEPKRRPVLLAAAFRAMPTIFVSGAGRLTWGDLPPEAHFYFAMTRLAPLVDAELVDAAVRAIPPAWSDESRGSVLAMVAAALPAPLRRARLRDFLAAIPAPESGEAVAAARLELAADLPPEDVREALDHVLRTQTIPSTRAPLIANVLRALPSSSTPVYAARVRADIAASPDADSRIDAAALVLDALAGLRRR
jgi:hypothetical protein